MTIANEKRGQQDGREKARPGNEVDRVYDELLVTLAQLGDRRAANRLAARWHPRMANTAKRLLRDDALAQEAVQDAWLGIARGLYTLRDPAKFPAWAFGILHRKCADRLRYIIKHRTQTTAMTDSLAATLSAPTDEPETRLSLETAFARLSIEHRTVAVLFFSEGLTLREIAEVVNIPVGTAKSRIFNARKHLQSMLEPQSDRS